MKMNKRLMIAVLLILLMSTPMLAQIGTPGDDGPGGPGDAAPIDGLIGLGLMVGAYFGVRKQMKSKD